MTDAIRVFAGDCTTTFEDGDEHVRRGEVVVVIKPDDTVLVHDRAGYRPVAWLTRPDALVYEGTTDGDTAGEEDGFSLTAVDGDSELRVFAHERYGLARYPASVAGAPVGTCPDCAGALVETGGAVHCPGCGDRYGLPTGATVREKSCSACGLPTMRVERGRVFDLCVDYECESLDDAVRSAFDRAWDCPDCGGDLRILRRGGLLAGCENHPDCDRAFSIPSGVVSGECGCGLPVFETGNGERCLDSTCER